MARRLRHYFPGATYHVILRGNDGQPIFFSDSDRCRMCLLMQEGVERFGHRILAFCLMTNHVHLAIQVGEVSLSAIIQNLAFRYTRYINRQFNRIGHLFQGRFKSIVTDSNRYLMVLIRYIHLNPIRAGMVRSPENYYWSSHRAYLFLNEFVWLTTSYMLKCFDANPKSAIKRFHSYVLAGIGVEEELDFEAGLRDGMLGEDDFVEMVKRKCHDKGSPCNQASLDLHELVEPVLSQYNVDEEELRSASKERKVSYVRAILAVVVKQSPGLTLQELSEYLNRDLSALSKAASRIEVKARQNTTLAKEIKEIARQLAEMSICQA